MSYWVDLLLRAPVRPSQADLSAWLNAYFAAGVEFAEHPRAAEPADANGSAAATLAAWRVTVRSFAESTGADGVVEIAAHAEPSRAVELREAIKQTWDWPDAVEACMQHAATLRVTDVSPQPLPARDRVALMHGAVRGLVGGLAGTEDGSPLLAIHWEPAQRIVEPMHYQSVLEAGDWLYGGAVNVRLAQVEDGLPNETIMDTMGLAALGLPDVQCHFVRLDPNAVAELLYGYAHYLFQNGDVIQDGHTVQGVDPAEKWPVRHEPALLEPERTVLNLHPLGASAVLADPGGDA